MRIFTIQIPKKTALIAVFCFFGCVKNVFAQNKVVSGVVVEASTNQPLIGATIRVKGTSNGVSTDLNGKFKIEAAANAVLQVSSITYRSVEVPAEYNAPMVIKLSSVDQNLKEVVIVAYGETTKKKLTTAVTSVDMKQIQELTGYSNIGSALQGRSPGVIINNSSGAIGSRPSISIRGGSDPLYVIDGTLSTSEIFYRLNPEDIESISIMKDAASSAVYGAVAGNGIFVVTTKKGTKGRNNITYNVEDQFVQPIIPKLVGGYDFAVATNFANTYVGGSPVYNAATLDSIKNNTSKNFPVTDWWDKLEKKYSLGTRHLIAMDGGDSLTTYRVSFSYYHQNGIQKPVNGQDIVAYNDYSTQASLTHNFNKIGLVLTYKLRGQLGDNNNYGQSGYNNFANVVRYDPIIRAFNDDGTYYGIYQNPAQMQDPLTGYNKTTLAIIDNNVNAELKIPHVKGLSAVFFGNFNYTTNQNKIWSAPGAAPKYNANGTLFPADATPSLTQTKSYSWVYDINPGLKYQTTINNVHNIKAQAYYNISDSYNDSFTVTRINYPSTAVDQLFAGPTDGQTTSGSAGNLGRLGLVGTLSYDFKSKYIVEGSFRYDGSDYYAPGHKWGFFPSVSVGYNITDESFMSKIKQITTLSQLKIRLGYGKTGVSNYRQAYYASYGINPTGYVLGTAFATTLSAPGIAGQDYTWYDNTNINAAVDFGFLDNRLTGSYDHFFTRIKNYIVSPAAGYIETLGTSLPLVNSPQDEYRRVGDEIVLNWNDRIGSVGYSIGGNVSLYNAMFVYQTQDAITLLNPLTRAAQHPNSDGSRTYIAGGIYQNAGDLTSHVRTDNAPLYAGDLYYKDVNGDGHIDDNDNVYNNKPSSPLLQYGINFGINYKGFALNGLMQGSGSNYKMMSSNLAPVGIYKLNYQFQTDYWTPTNTGARFPRPDNGSGPPNNTLNSTWYLIDATYWRLKNLNLSYDLKYKLLKNVKSIANCRLSISGQNLVTISPANGYFDPETGNLDGWGYPLSRVYSVSLNVGF